MNKIYYFGAEWCGPCKVLKPIFKELAEKYSDIPTMIYDVDKDIEKSKQFNISSMPTIVVVDQEEKLIKKYSPIQINVLQKLFESGAQPEFSKMEKYISSFNKEENYKTDIIENMTVVEIPMLEEMFKFNLSIDLNNEWGSKEDIHKVKPGKFCFIEGRIVYSGDKVYLNVNNNKIIILP